MITRYEYDEIATLLPEAWVSEVEKLLHSVYENQTQALNKIFEVVACSYPKEIVLAVSLLDKDDSFAIPVSYIASVDQDNLSSDKVKKLLDTLVDSVGVFFDNYFAQPDWNDYNSNWEEVDFKGTKVYFRVSRENVKLTLQADEILKNS